MKQYISSEKVNSELNDSQRSDLKRALESFDGYGGSFIKDPGLSIGQMIEFLKENEVLIGLETHIDGWMVVKNPETFEGDAYEELSDALWEAVKYKLKG